MEMTEVGEDGEWKENNAGFLQLMQENEEIVEMTNGIHTITFEKKEHSKSD